MRHLVDGRKFGRNTSARKAMFRSMAVNLLRHEQIRTTSEKAKELRRVVDRLITLGKRGGLHSQRLAFDRTRDGEVVKKLFTILSERYAKRAGGYTRVLRVDATRAGDGAEMAIIELVDRPIVEKKKVKKTVKKDHGHDHEHDHDHDHDHDHHEHGAEKKARAAGGKLKGAAAGNKGSTKAAGAKSAGLRKTPTKSGGGRSGGSS